MKKIRRIGIPAEKGPQLASHGERQMDQILRREQERGGQRAQGLMPHAAAGLPGHRGCRERAVHLMPQQPGQQGLLKRIPGLDRGQGHGHVKDLAPIVEQPSQGRAQPPVTLSAVPLGGIGDGGPPETRLAEGVQGVLRDLQAMREQAKGSAVMMRRRGRQVPAEGRQAV